MLPNHGLFSCRVNISKDFVEDVISWMDLAGEHGINMLKEILTDDSYAITVIKNKEIFPGPVHFLTVLHLKAQQADMGRNH
ncbi:MAG: hypothetical protein AB2689_08635 [Candidatus Thiodiazotropha taylori]